MPFRIRMLLIGASLACFAGMANAQEDEEELEVDLFFAPAETVTSAARHEQEIGWSPSAITVITREDIETSGATTVPDLLRMVPGMDVVLCSPFYASISSRLQWNFENSYFLVLIDGREANVELIGWAPWAIQPVSIEEIERIEVIRGPASALYGPNAFAGVVSITTRPVSEKATGFVQLSGGEIASLSGTAHASTRLDDWGISVSGGGDFMGRFTNPRSPGNRGWRFRTLVERRVSSEGRLLVDAGFSDGSGLTTSAAGTVDFGLGLSTLRAAYESDTLRAQLYWSYVRAEGNLEPILEYGGIRLARFRQALAHAHTLDGQLQWTPPRLWEPLLIIVGGVARVSRLSSDDLLDADSYPDITSTNYHQPGILRWEVRTGAFLHAELTPADWVTVTGSLRFDYNNVTEEFVSPRLATVFRPVPGHFLRLGAARAFRKPSFMETGFHMPVEFFEDSPITGTGREDFQEFMTRVIGNSQLGNEEIWSFEAGYQGNFLDGKLTLSLDIFCNLYRSLVEIQQRIYATDQGLPDLDRSSLMFENTDGGLDILGGELSVRYDLSRSLSLAASWAHRQVHDNRIDQWLSDTPKNLLTLGARFRTEPGLVGSLYLFSRSDFHDDMVENSAGILQPYRSQHMDNVFLVLGRLGWRLALPRDVQAEVGIRVFLPVSPFSSPHFRYHEKGGVVSTDGKILGGDELRRMLIGYLQGSF